jgi:hypothetical protein
MVRKITPPTNESFNLLFILCVQNVTITMNGRHDVHVGGYVNYNFLKRYIGLFIMKINRFYIVSHGELSKLLCPKKRSNNKLLEELLILFYKWSAG